MADADERPDDPATPASKAPRLLADRYELLEELGRGTAGRVYRAFDRLAGETIAVKLLAYEADDETMERLRRELRAARRVAHPGVVRLHDLMTFEGAPALTMELVEGDTLEAILARGTRLSAAEIVTLVGDLALAVAAAHRAGVVHRALKPANIILRQTTGRAVVTDFGISRITADVQPVSRAPHPSSGTLSTRLTEEGVLMGTPLYMAPEQLDPEAEVGPAADVFALGLIAWEAATGRPLDGDLDVNELMNVRASPRELHLRAVRGDLPERFCEAMDRCLALAPEDRFASAAELRAALDASGPPQVSARPRPRASPRASVAVAALGVAGLVGFAALALRSSPSTPSAAPAPTPSAAAPSPPVTSPATPWVPRIRQLSAREQNLDRPGFAPDGKSIVIPSSRGGHWDIWLFTPATDTWRPLTDDPPFDAAPQLVENGAAVAFYSERGGKRGLYRMPVDGGAPPKLLDAAVYVPFGAPQDGAKVFFSKDEHDLWSYDFAAGASSKLLTLESTERIVGITSDSLGERVALSVQRHPGEAKQSPESTNDLYVFRVGDAAGKFVTSDAKWHGTAAFAPGAKPALVSSSRRGGLLNLWRLPLDGGEPTQLVTGTGDDIYATPTWDGRSLLYVHDQTVRQLFVRPPHAKEWTRITHEAIDHQSPYLDDGGRRLTFVTYDRDKNARVAYEADAPSFEPARAMTLPISPIALYAPPGKKAIVAIAAMPAGAALVTIDRETRAVRVIAPGLSTASRFSLSKGGTRVAFIDGEGAQIWSLEEEPPARTTIAGARAVDFSPAREGELLVLRGLSPGEAVIEVNDVVTGKVRVVTRCADSARAAWAGASSVWIIPSLDRTLRRVDARDGHVLETITAAGDNMLSLAVASDGTLVAESAIGESRLFFLENLDTPP